MKYWILISILFFTQVGKSQTNYSKSFQEAYKQNPNIPKWVLEAVSYTNTHILHIQSEKEISSCLGLPLYYGIMGLVNDGKGYFRNNFQTISTLSKVSIDKIKSNP